MSLRIVFMGTPEFAVPTLLELHRRGHQVTVVYSRAPKPANRGMKTLPTPVAAEAQLLKIPVMTPNTLKGDEAVRRSARAFMMEHYLPEEPWLFCVVFIIFPALMFAGALRFFRQHPAA